MVQALPRSLTRRRRSGLALAIAGVAVLLAAAVPAAASDARPLVATLRDLGPALTACWRAPAGSTGSEITVAFSLDRSGALIGKPRITYSKLGGVAADKRDFVAAALSALSACLPLNVSPGLGGAIAGRPLTVRFVGPPGATAEL